MLNYFATYFYYNNTDLNPSISKKKGRKIGLILSHVALFFSKSYEGYFELCLKHSFSSSRKTQWKSRDEWVNPFLGTCLLLYTLKTCFKWVQKETSGREWMRPFQVIILSVKPSCSRGIQREFNLKSVKKISCCGVFSSSQIIVQSYVFKHLTHAVIVFRVNNKHVRLCFILLKNTTFKLGIARLRSASYFTQ